MPPAPAELARLHFGKFDAKALRRDRKVAPTKPRGLLRRLANALTGGKDR